MSPVSDVDDVVWMVRGAWVSLCVRATCELGVVDELDQPRTLAELAVRLTAEPATLDRLLRVLVDLGLLELRGELYAATPRGAVLRTGHPSDVRSLALMQTVVPNLTAWHHLADAVRRGGAMYEELNGRSYWSWLSSHPAEETVFDAAMGRRAALQVDAIRAATDLSAARLLVDVGGGRGAMVAGLLAHHPELAAIVADRPDVALAATAALASAGFGDRARGEPSDFFISVPSDGDVYVLANVLHDWDDAAAIGILRTVHTAMAPGARLLVVENVLDDPGRTPEQQRDVDLVDLHMLVMFGGRERPKAGYDVLLVAAGFEPSTRAPSPNTWNVLRTSPPSGQSGRGDLSDAVD